MLFCMYPYMWGDHASCFAIPQNREVTQVASFIPIYEATICYSLVVDLDHGFLFDAVPGGGRAILGAFTGPKWNGLWSMWSSY